jgi:hypothetical protein
MLPPPGDRIVRPKQPEHHTASVQEIAEESSPSARLRGTSTES